MRRSAARKNTYVLAHMRDDVVSELGAFAEGGAFHLAFEVVCYRLCGDGAFDAFDDQVCGFLPAEVFEHEDAGEDH